MLTQEENDLLTLTGPEPEAALFCAPTGCLPRSRRNCPWTARRCASACSEKIWSCSVTTRDGRGFSDSTVHIVVLISAWDASRTGASLSLSRVAFRCRRSLSRTTLRAARQRLQAQSETPRLSLSGKGGDHFRLSRSGRASPSPLLKVSMLRRAPLCHQTVPRLQLLPGARRQHGPMSYVIPAPAARCAPGTRSAPLPEPTEPSRCISTSRTRRRHRNG